MSSGSALQRAREEAMKGAGKYEGEWLENDSLIANQLIFNITDVRDDRGGGYNGQDRWVLRVEPFFEDDADPDGLVSLTDNPARRKFMDVIDKELDALLQKGSDPVIGPCVMVRLKGKNYRYNEIVDWNVEEMRPNLPPGAILAGARVEDDMPPRRPRRGAAQSEPEPAPAPEPEAKDSRPFAAAVAAKAQTASPPTQTVPDTTANASAPNAGTVESPESDASPASPTPAATGRRRRAATTEPSMPSTSSPPAGTAPTAEFPPLVEWARDNRGYRRGRVSKEIIADYEEAKAQAGLDPQNGQSERSPASSQAPTSSPSRSARRPTAQEGSTDDVAAAIAAAKHAVPEPADVPVGAPHRDMTNPLMNPHERAVATHATEVKFSPGMTGWSKEACPACGKKMHDRIFPTGEPGSNSYALVHARCEAGGEQLMMEAVPDA